jgi:hypothetical protein
MQLQCPYQRIDAALWQVRLFFWLLWYLIRQKKIIFWYCDLTISKTMGHCFVNGHYYRLFRNLSYDQATFPNVYKNSRPSSWVALLRFCLLNTTRLSVVTDKIGQSKIGYFTYLSVILLTQIKLLFYLFYVLYLFYRYFTYFIGILHIIQTYFTALCNFSSTKARRFGQKKDWIQLCFVYSCVPLFKRSLVWLRYLVIGEINCIIVPVIIIFKWWFIT